MKMIKKITMLMLSLCLTISCFSMSAYAANGKIMFTDPSATEGQTVEVKGVVERTDGTGFGKIVITMTYDTTLLKCKSGNGVIEPQPGIITYMGDATNETGKRHEFKIQFEALKEGTAKLQITQATVKAVTGSILDYTKGNSTITIVAAAVEDTTTTPSVPVAGNGDKVKVHGKEYTVSNTFPEDEIPNGYTKATLEYGVGTYNVVYSETSGMYLAYLVNAENLGRFFMYMEEDATFAPFEQITISDNVTIALLVDTSDIVLPKEYNETTVVLNGQEFPAWHSTEDKDFYVIYAINNSGEKSLYRLDNVEATYQRFTAPEVVEEKKEGSTFVDTLGSFMQKHMDRVILGTGIGFLMLVVIIVILGVKLYNRNAELDEIYDDEEETEDDVMLALDDEDEEGDEEPEDDSETDSETDPAIELFVQEGMKEVFPEEEPDEDAEIREMKKLVEALPKALAEEETAKDSAEFYDEEDIFENFSIDFIDLDD